MYIERFHDVCCDVLVAFSVQITSEIELMSQF